MLWSEVAPRNSATSLMLVTWSACMLPSKYGSSSWPLTTSRRFTRSSSPRASTSSYRLQRRPAVRKRCSATLMAMPSCSGSMQERRPRLRHQRNRTLGTSPFSNFGCSVTCSSGEPPIGAWFLTYRHAWLVVLGEDLANEFSAAAHSDLVKHGLEVIPHRVGRDVQLLGGLGRGEPRRTSLVISPSRFVRP
jgi:hypothetical protein